MSEWTEPMTDDVRFIAEVDPTLGWVRGDAKRLQQAMTVLLRGVRSMVSPGGTLALRATNLDVVDKVSHRYGVRSGPYVIVEVGTGELDNTAATSMMLFEPWATREESAPIGELGLASVEVLIRRWGGALGVEGHPGGVSCVAFLLPRLSSPAAGQAVAPTTLPVRPGAGTVLVVDDERAVLRVARRALTVCGYRVLTASSVGEARRLMVDHASSIDLLLTDVRMPDGTGPEVAADLISRNGAVRVLYMSGYAANELDDVLGPEAERVLLQKPFTLRELLDEVELALA
jgi:CheY-like chemotaxis protein